MTYILTKSFLGTEATPCSPTRYPLDDQDLSQPCRKFTFSPFRPLLLLKCVVSGDPESNQETEQRLLSGYFMTLATSGVPAFSRSGFQFVLISLHCSLCVPVEPLSCSELYPQSRVGNCFPCLRTLLHAGLEELHREVLLGVASQAGDVGWGRLKSSESPCGCAL